MVEKSWSFLLEKISESYYIVINKDEFKLYEKNNFISISF